MLFRSFKHWKIGTKILSMFIILIVSSLWIQGALTYRTVRRSLLDRVEDQLRLQALDWLEVVKATYSQIKSSEDNINKVARSITSAQAEAVYRLIEGYNQPDLEPLKNTLASISVGKTGYVFVFDYNGNYIVSKNRENEGENLWDRKDNVGNYFIRDIIQKGKKLQGDGSVTSTYLWQDPGEIKPREKLAAVINIPKYNWIVGIGVYLDELTDVNLIAKLQEQLKTRIAAQRIGRTGYIYVLDEQGRYVVSQSREQDGEDIWNSKDSMGNYFIQEIIKKAKVLGDRGTAIHYYPWQDIRESKPRMKVVGLSYFPEWKWIIGVGAYQEDFKGPLNRVRNITIYVAVISVLVAVLIALGVANIITRPISSLLKMSARAAEGDLAVKIDTESEDEIGEVGRAFNALVSSLAGVVTQIRRTTEKVTVQAQGLSASAEQINASTQETSSTIQQISKGTTSQSQKSDEVFRVMEQMSELVKKIAANAQATSQAAGSTTKSAQEGYEAASAATKMMERISGTVTSSADVVDTLGRRTREIGEIVNVITGISDQTNLLALNAAIEAARAGEAGRGFAVVSEEVRKLAEGSARSAEQITRLVEGVQSETSKAVNAMEQGKREVLEGKVITDQAGKALEEITRQVDRVSSMIQEITSATQMQISGTQQTVKAVEEVAIVAKQTASATEEASSAIEEQTAAMQGLSASSQELSQMAVELRNMVSKFKLDGEDK